jgi:hypothetical protein
MKLSSTILGSVVFVLSITGRCFSQVTYDFQGVISSSNSSIYPIGDSLDFTFTLASQTPASHMVIFPGYTQYTFSVLSATMSINGDKILLPALAPSPWGLNVPVETDSSTTGIEYGFGDQTDYTGLYGNYLPHDCEFRFASTSAANVDSNMLPLPGLPISDFSENVLAVYDQYGNDGRAEITSYSVTGLAAIPESSSFALIISVLTLFGVIILRYKSRPAGVWLCGLW